MIDEDETLESVMQMLKIRSGKDNYLAIINFLPDPNMTRVGDRHVVNLKFIRSLGYFIRIDSEEPYPEPIGLTDNRFFKSTKEIDIYAAYLSDITKGTHQMNKAGVTANTYYTVTGNTMPKRFPKHQPKSNKSCLHRPVFIDPPTHPDSTKRCSDYWLTVDTDAV